jgi:hypothetical protein
MISIGRIGLIALLILTGAYSTTSKAADVSVVGSWRLVSWVEVETESKSVCSVFGDTDRGDYLYA